MKNFCDFLLYAFYAFVVITFANNLSNSFNIEDIKYIGISILLGAMAMRLTILEEKTKDFKK